MLTIYCKRISAFLVISSLIQTIPGHVGWAQLLESHQEDAVVYQNPEDGGAGKEHTAMQMAEVAALDGPVADLDPSGETTRRNAELEAQERQARLLEEFRNRYTDSTKGIVVLKAEEVWGAIWEFSGSYATLDRLDYSDSASLTNKTLLALDFETVEEGAERAEAEASAARQETERREQIQTDCRELACADPAYFESMTTEQISARIQERRSEIDLEDQAARRAEEDRVHEQKLRDAAMDRYRAAYRNGGDLQEQELTDIRYDLEADTVYFSVDGNKCKVEVSDGETRLERAADIVVSPVTAGDGSVEFRVDGGFKKKDGTYDATVTLLYSGISQSFVGNYDPETGTLTFDGGHHGHYGYLNGHYTVEFRPESTASQVVKFDYATDPSSGANPTHETFLHDPQGRILLLTRDSSSNGTLYSRRNEFAYDSDGTGRLWTRQTVVVSDGQSETTDIVETIQDGEDFFTLNRKIVDGVQSAYVDFKKGDIRYSSQHTDQAVPQMDVFEQRMTLSEGFAVLESSGSTDGHQSLLANLGAIQQALQSNPSLQGPGWPQPQLAIVNGVQKLVMVVNGVQVELPAGIHPVAAYILAATSNSNIVQLVLQAKEDGVSPDVIDVLMQAYVKEFTNHPDSNGSLVALLSSQLSIFSSVAQNEKGAKNSGVPDDVLSKFMKKYYAEATYELTTESVNRNGHLLAKLIAQLTVMASVASAGEAAKYTGLAQSVIDRIMGQLYAKIRYELTDESIAYNQNLLTELQGVFSLTQQVGTPTSANGLVPVDILLTLLEAYYSKITYSLDPNSINANAALLMYLQGQLGVFSSATKSIAQAKQSGVSQTILDTLSQNFYSQVANDLSYNSINANAALLMYLQGQLGVFSSAAGSLAQAKQSGVSQTILDNLSQSFYSQANRFDLTYEGVNANAALLMYLQGQLSIFIATQQATLRATVSQAVAAQVTEMALAAAAAAEAVARASDAKAAAEAEMARVSESAQAAGQTLQSAFTLREEAQSALSQDPENPAAIEAAAAADLNYQNAAEAKQQADGAVVTAAAGVADAESKLNEAISRSQSADEESAKAQANAQNLAEAEREAEMAAGYDGQAVTFGKFGESKPPFAPNQRGYYKRLYETDWLPVTHGEDIYVYTIWQFVADPEPEPEPEPQPEPEPEPQPEPEAEAFVAAE